MSTIGSQTIKGSIYSYLGLIIGFLSITLLRSHCLTTDEVGTLEVITSYVMILAQIGSFGFFNGSIRFFPYFRNPEKNHHGFMFLLFAIPLIGTIFFILLYFVLNLLLPANSYFQSLQEYAVPILIFTAITMLFSIFDTYNRVALFDAVTGSTLNQFVLKITVAIAMGIMLFFALPFNQFLMIWLFANSIPTIIIFFKLKRQKQINLKPDFEFLNPPLIKMMSSVSFFAVITGFTSMVTLYIDRIMIDGMINSSLTGIYGTTVLFGTVVSMPSKVMYRVGGIIISEKWKANDLTGIASVYRKSCINQLLIGLLLFIGIWANIDNIFKMLPAGYEAGKYVILFISLGYLIEMSTGLNGVILSTSKYYKYDSYFFIALIFITIASNYFLIPIWGITGSAIASALTLLLFNLFRFLFIWRKFKIQPMSVNNLIILIIGLAVLFVIGYLPAQSLFIVDIIIRSTIITILYVGSIYIFKLSPEMNNVINNMWNKIFN